MGEHRQNRIDTKLGLALPTDVATQWVSYGPAIALAPDATAAICVFTNFQQFGFWRTDTTFGIPSFAGSASGEPISPSGSPVAGVSVATPEISPATRAAASARRFDLPVPEFGRLDSDLGSVAAVAPGGRIVAFAAGDESVEFWDALTGTTRSFKQGGNGSANRMTFSADGAWLAVANSRTVAVWSVAGQRPMHTFQTLNFNWATSPQVMSLAFSFNGRHVMAGYFDGSVRVHPLAEGGREIVLRGHDSQVRGLALLPDDRTLISASTELRVWDIVEGRELFQLSPRPGMFFNLALSPDGRRLAAGSGSGVITIWDTASWQEVATLTGHSDTVYHLAFSADGHTLLSASAERLRVWRSVSSTGVDEVQEAQQKQRP